MGVYGLYYGVFLIGLPRFYDLPGVQIVGSRNTGYIKDASPKGMQASGSMCAENRRF